MQKCKKKHRIRSLGPGLPDIWPFISGWPDTEFDIGLDTSVHLYYLSMLIVGLISVGSSCQLWVSPIGSTTAWSNYSGGNQQMVIRIRWFLVRGCVPTDWFLSTFNLFRHLFPSRWFSSFRDTIAKNEEHIPSALSVSKFTANMYCICSIDLQYRYLRRCSTDLR